MADTKPKSRAELTISEGFGRALYKCMILSREPVWTISMLAAELGVSRTTVRDWLSGKRTPDPENLSEITQLFGVSREVLLGGQYSRIYEIYLGQERGSRATTSLDTRKIAAGLEVAAEGFTSLAASLQRAAEIVTSEPLKSLSDLAVEDAERGDALGEEGGTA